MKKAWKCCSALMLTVMILMTTVGCLGGTAREFEVGDFKFYQGEEGADLYIMSLTEEGLQKRVLIVPEKVDNAAVTHIMNPRLWGGGVWRSEKLEKLYLPWNLYVDTGTLNTCDNLYAVFLLSNREEGFYPSYVISKGQVFYTNYYLYNEIYTDSTQGKPANVTYYYNDGRTENYGCFWIDNVPYGSVLDVLPPEDPISEGKTFAGWYKEPECINAWDFETDITPAEKLDEDGNVIYQETALYAKWI